MQSKPEVEGRIHTSALENDLRANVESGPIVEKAVKKKIKMRTHGNDESSLRKE